MARVDGKVVLISGGARGMGASHGEKLVSEGARVVVGDILDDNGLAVAETLGPSAHFTHLDVTDPDQWDGAVEAAVQRFGRLDALVNNAGIVKMAPLRGSSLSDWQRVLDVNLTGAYLGMCAVIEPMIAGGGGSIVNVGGGIGRQRSSAQLCGGEVRPAGDHQVGRCRVGAIRYPAQLHPSRSRAHPDEQRCYARVHGADPDAPWRVARRGVGLRVVLGQ